MLTKSRSTISQRAVLLRSWPELHDVRVQPTESAQRYVDVHGELRLSFTITNTGAGPRSCSSPRRHRDRADPARTAAHWGSPASTSRLVRVSSPPQRSITETCRTRWMWVTNFFDADYRTPLPGSAGFSNWTEGEGGTMIAKLPDTKTMPLEKFLIRYSIPLASN